MSPAPLAGPVAAAGVGELDGRGVINELLGLVAGGEWVSYIRTATTSPEAAVSAATAQTAVVMPKASASRPAAKAPTAKPPSRQSR